MSCLHELGSRAAAVAHLCLLVTCDDPTLDQRDRAQARLMLDGALDALRVVLANPITEDL